MSIKFIPKVGVALFLLAIVLIFLGVNYVPQIYATSLSRRSTSDSVVVARPNYVNELYPRSIAPQLSLAGSDWIERHPLVIAPQASFVSSNPFERILRVNVPRESFLGSDPLERSFRVIAPQVSFMGTDSLERSFRVIVPQLSLAGSDWIERHPSVYFTSSDRIDHRTIYPRVK